MARIIRRSRWLLVRWVLFLLIVGTVLGVCFLMCELDSLIHKRTLDALQERFAAADAYAASAHLIRGEGIELSRFVLLANYKSTNSDSHTSFPPVLEAERVMIRCPSRIEELAVAKEVPIECVTFDTATIHAYRRPNGSWSLAAFETNPNVISSFPAPIIQFRNTSIVLHDMMDSKTDRKLVLRNVELTIEKPKNTSEDAFGNPAPQTVKEGTTPDESSTFSASPFHGTADSEFCRSIRFSGLFFGKEGEIWVDVDVDELQYSEDFRNTLPLEVAERFQELKAIRGTIDTHIKVASHLKKFDSAAFRLTGRMVDGRSQDPRFPKLVSNLATDFQITNEGFVFSNLNLRFGGGTVELNVLQRGYGPRAQRRIVSKSRKIELNEGFASALPASLGRLLHDLSPTGRFNMNAEFVFDGQYWTTTGNIACSDVSINYVRFPYRLEHLSGTIELRGNHVRFQFQTPPQHLSIQGDFTMSSKQNPQPPGGTILVKAQNIPIEERLVAACPAAAANFIRTLEVGGNVDVGMEYRFLMDPQNPESHAKIQITLLKNSCRYKDFPYPLRNMEGTIFIEDQTISAENIRGSNNNASVALSFHAHLPDAPFDAREISSENQNLAGNPAFNPALNPAENPSSAPAGRGISGPNSAEMQTDALSAASLLSPPPISGVEWDLSLVGKNITLDDELYANLPKQVSEIFRYIQPYGTVDVRYEYRSPQGSILPGAPAAFRTPSHRALWVDSVGDGIRIALPAMSYNLDRFRGSFQYNNGNFSLTDFSAVHGSTKFSGKAEGSVDSVNQWSVHLNRILIDNLQFDHDLMTAIPEEARIVIAAKRPEGALYYDGRMDIHYDNQTSKPFSLDWKGEIGIVGGSLDLGFPLNAINGGIEICGHWDQNTFQCGGELEIESLFQQNLQFTNICGPIWIDNQQLLLGGEAEKRLRDQLNYIPPNASPNATRALNAKFIGGDIYGTFVLRFGYPSVFQSHIVLTNGRLENCAILTGNDELKARMFGTLTLSGTDSSLHSLRGKGEFHLADANIYKLSVMMSLLKILSLKEVNTTGFSSSDMRFHIEGNHFYFDQIDFSGDAFSLIGKGEMDFKSQVKLVFYSVMGRNEHHIPIISPLLHATGRQMMLITIRGPLQNPEITQQPLPGLNMAIQQMENDFPQRVFPLESPAQSK